MGLKLNSKLFVITGSAGGLGKAFAVKLLSLGSINVVSNVTSLSESVQVPKFVSQTSMRAWELTPCPSCLPSLARTGLPSLSATSRRRRASPIWSAKQRSFSSQNYTASSIMQVLTLISSEYLNESLWINIFQEWWGKKKAGGFAWTSTSLESFMEPTLRWSKFQYPKVCEFI